MTWQGEWVHGIAINLPTMWQRTSPQIPTRHRSSLPFFSSTIKIWFVKKCKAKYKAEFVIFKKLTFFKKLTYFFSWSSSSFFSQNLCHKKVSISKKENQVSMMKEDKKAPFFVPGRLSCCWLIFFYFENFGPCPRWGQGDCAGRQGRDGNANLLVLDNELISRPLSIQKLPIFWLSRQKSILNTDFFQKCMSKLLCLLLAFPSCR